MARARSSAEFIAMDGIVRTIGISCNLNLESKIKIYAERTTESPVSASLGEPA